MAEVRQVATKIEHIRAATSFVGTEIATSDDLYMITKRLIDVLLAILLLIVLMPVMLLISLAILLDSSGPIIFRQKRVLGEQTFGSGDPGKHVFEFYKFRTMYHHANEDLHRQYMKDLINGDARSPKGQRKQIYKLDQDPRVTRVGHFLRKSSLDELPQLINILCGQMSFVGPRPAIAYEVRQYKPWHMYRLTVMQGLTGLWQVMGRNERSFDEMVQLDIEYAQRRSLLLDIKIMFATIPAILGGHGAC